MNKLTIFAILALIGCAAAAVIEPVVEEPTDMESQIALLPSDQEESKYLPGEAVIFSDFCVQSRDQIKSFMTETTNGFAASIFEILFSSASEVGSDLIDSEKEAVEKGAKMIASKTVQTPEKESEVSENVSMGTVVASAVKTVINAVVETAQTQILQRIALLRAQFDGENLKIKINRACQGISFDLMNRLEDSMNKAKSSIKSTAAKSGNQNLLDVVAKTNIENVKCLTVGRVVKISQFCNVLKMAGSTIYPLLGLN